MTKFGFIKLLLFVNTMFIGSSQAVTRSSVDGTLKRLFNHQPAVALKLSGSEEYTVHENMIATKQANRGLDKVWLGFKDRWSSGVNFYCADARFD